MKLFSLEWVQRHCVQLKSKTTPCSSRIDRLQPKLTGHLKIKRKRREPMKSPLEVSLPGLRLGTFRDASSRLALLWDAKCRRRDQDPCGSDVGGGLEHWWKILRTDAGVSRTGAESLDAPVKCWTRSTHLVLQGQTQVGFLLQATTMINAYPGCKRKTTPVVSHEDRGYRLPYVEDCPDNTRPCYGADHPLYQPTIPTTLVRSCTLDTRRHQLHSSNHSVRLTAKEYGCQQNAGTCSDWHHLGASPARTAFETLLKG